MSVMGHLRQIDTCPLSSERYQNWATRRKALSAISCREQSQQKKSLFEHIVSLGEQHRRQLDAEGLGSF